MPQHLCLESCASSLVLRRVPSVLRRAACPSEALSPAGTGVQHRRRFRGTSFINNLQLYCRATTLTRKELRRPEAGGLRVRPHRLSAIGRCLGIPISHLVSTSWTAQLDVPGDRFRRRRLTKTMRPTRRRRRPTGRGGV